MPIVIDAFDPRGATDGYFSEITPNEVSKQVSKIRRTDGFPGFGHGPNVLAYKLDAPVDTYSSVNRDNPLGLYACMVKMSSLDKDRMVLTADDYAERAKVIHREATRGYEGRTKELMASKVGGRLFDTIGASEKFDNLSQEDLYYWAFSMMIRPVETVHAPNKTFQIEYKTDSTTEYVTFGKQAYETLMDTDYPDDHWAFHTVSSRG